uniref:Presenilin n=2 Tax=Parascaris univalens TaxID=6257 RepID=A0A914ZR73_PARUN
MILVSLHSKFVLQHKYLDAYAPYLMFKQEEQTGWDTLWKSMIVAAIFVGLIIAVTSLIVFAYFMKWYKAILVVIMLNCFLLFSLLTFDLLNSIVTIYNIHGDYITLALFMYNYGALGMMSIFWTAPLMIQQVYLVMISALVSIMLLHLFPSWAVWTVLAALALWDVVAVLCPFGPLQILIKLSRERNEPIMPALIYSAGLIYMNTKEDGQEALALHSCRVDSIPSTEKPGSPECERLLCDDKIQQAQAEEKSEARLSDFSAHERQMSSASSGRAGLSSENPRNTSGTQTSARSGNNALPVNSNGRANSGRASRSEAIKLGLGDFIFYGVLIGKASGGGILATISCFTAILIGLCATLVFLFIYGRALPALPISIFMGISFYFATYFLVDPFCESVSMRQLIL